ncbi:30S ribosomal protein S8 [bacterium]|nr:30S ribosomal protein S8 [bacterium]
MRPSFCTLYPVPRRVKTFLNPWVRNGLGTALISTSQGMMSDRQARRLKVGGEVVCEVW